jgi:hypothetical protein
MYDMRFYKNMVSLLVLVLFFWIPCKAVLGEVFLCRPWGSVGSGGERFIGESFTSKIENGTISFFGDKRPVRFATMIATHPVHDIFLATTGEVLSATPMGNNQIKISIYFPNREYSFFLKTFCNQT